MSTDRDQVNRAAWRWEEGAVNTDKNHLILSHDAAALPVAMVGQAADHVFAVDLAMPRDVSSPSDARIIADVCRELDFYLVELNEPDPWAYAIYHCGTVSNVYHRFTGRFT